MQLKAVAFLWTHNRARATLGAHGMRAHDLYLGHDSDVGRTPRSYADFYRSTQTC